MRQLIKTLERLDVDVLLHFVGDGHPAGLRTRLTSRGWQQHIRRLAVERSHTALDAIAHATGVYFPRRAHGARIAIKQLRYAGEIALRAGFGDMRSAISALKRGQEVLGELHDKQVLADNLDSYTKREGIDKGHIELTRKVLEGEVLALHADYLCRREKLRDACADIERVASHQSHMRSTIGVSAAVVSGLVYAGVAHTVRGQLKERLRHHQEAAAAER
jgi:CHAD domain-containing protein